MAVKIRLSRYGKKKQPSYRVVVVDEDKKRDGAYIENLGYYNPSIKPEKVKIDKKRVDYWKEKGAQITKAVRRLLEKK